MDRKELQELYIELNKDIPVKLQYISIFSETLELCRDCEVDELGRIFKELINAFSIWPNDYEPEGLSRIEKLIYGRLVSDLDKSGDRYLHKVQTNRRNGEKKKADK